MTWFKLYRIGAISLKQLWNGALFQDLALEQRRFPHDFSHEGQPFAGQQGRHRSFRYFEGIGVSATNQVVVTENDDHHDQKEHQHQPEKKATPNVKTARCARRTPSRLWQIRSEHTQSWSRKPFWLSPVSSGPSGMSPGSSGCGSTAAEAAGIRSRPMMISLMFCAPRSGWSVGCVSF